MDTIRKSDILSYNNELFHELYSANTLVNITITSCQSREFKGQYYGAKEEILKRLSDERNEYITMLTLISDKLACIMDINLNIEKELTLHKNPDYSRR